MKKFTFIAVVILMILNISVFSQPTYLAINSVSIVPTNPTSSDVINFHFTGYLSSSNVSVSSILISQNSNQIDFLFNTQITGVGLPVIINFDTVLSFGPLNNGFYHINPTGYGVSNFADTTSLYFMVNDTTLSNCQAFFASQPDSGIWIPEVIPIAFTDLSTSTSTIISWFWDFGDGTTSNLQNPAHGYDFMSPGIYTVCLTITTSDGCTSTYCGDVYVGTPQNCQANFSGVNITGNPFGYQFTDYSTGNPVSWIWDFGDGSILTMQNPFYMFQNSGYFYVCLTIFTSDSCSSTSCQYFLVGATDSCQGVIINTNPIIVNASSSSACDGSITISLSGGISPYWFQWSNGSTSNTISQLCVGYYLVNGVDGNYCMFSDTIYVNYENNPCDSVDVITTFSITDASSETANDGSIQLVLNGLSPYSFLWSNGESIESPTFLPGNYSVTVSDANGCTETLDFTINWINQIQNLYEKPISIYADVFLNKIEIQWIVKNSFLGKIKIFDISGQLITSKIIEFSPYNSKYYIDLPLITKGFYVLAIEPVNFIQKIIFY